MATAQLKPSAQAGSSRRRFLAIRMIEAGSPSAECLPGSPKIGGLSGWLSAYHGRGTVAFSSMDRGPLQNLGGTLHPYFAAEAAIGSGWP